MGTTWPFDQGLHATLLQFSADPGEGPRAERKGLADFAHACQFRFHQLSGREAILDLVLHGETVEGSLVNKYRSQTMQVLKPHPAIDRHGPLGQSLLPIEILLTTLHVHPCYSRQPVFLITIHQP